MWFRCSVVRTGAAVHSGSPIASYERTVSSSVRIDTVWTEAREVGAVHNRRVRSDSQDLLRAGDFNMGTSSSRVDMPSEGLTADRYIQTCEPKAIGEGPVPLTR